MCVIGNCASFSLEWILICLEGVSSHCIFLHPNQCYVCMYLLYVLINFHRAVESFQLFHKQL